MVNLIPAVLKGPVIFFSLLPMIVTPLVGSLVLFWMINSRGIPGAALQWVFGDPSLSLTASPTLTRVTLFVYGVWQSAPFAFVVPYLVPLATFIGLMQLMDNFRVFEPIIGFSAAASATTLSYLIYNELRLSDTPLFNSAAATSMLTIIGVLILLTPVLRRNRRDFNRKST